MVEPSLRRGVRELLARRDPVTEECARLLKVVRERCPGLLPEEPLPAGTVGPAIDINPDELQGLATIAAARAAGLPDDARTDTVVWTQGASELLVIVSRVRIRVDTGLVLVRIPVSCDQAPSAFIEVGFAVGDDERPAGLLAATEDRPRGPRVVVDLWGEVLTAFAWQIVLSVTAGVAGATGEDADRAPLVPVALTAHADGVRVLTMARHTFDRVVR